MRLEAGEKGAAVHEALTRTLDWPDCKNVRDLGGLPRDGGFTRLGVLIRSDTVTHLTAEGLDAMIGYGINTVIDLRTAAELKGEGPRAGGVRYLDLLLVEEVKATVEQAPPGVGRYIRIVEDRQAAFAEVFNAIAEADGPVLFHCFAGKDRTGLVAAMLLELAGVARENIAADYGETDLQLAQQYEIWLSQAPPDQLEEMRADLSCSADRILGVLDHIDAKWGGVASYLEAAGVQSSTVDAVCSRLI